MASSTANPPAPNLATLLLIKRKMAAKGGSNAGENQAQQPPPAVIGAYSNEKITYRQDMPVENPTQTTTSTTNGDETSKVSRKTKQLEINLLDKKMEEINRKQEATTNETLSVWKGFDSLNYGFTNDFEAQRSTPVPSAPTKQHTSTPSPLPKTQPSPEKTAETPVRQQSAEKQTSRQSRPPEENVDKQPPPPSPPRQKTIEKQPSPPPTPPPRRSKVKPESPLEKSTPPKSPTPITETITPISSIVSNPQIFEKHAQSPEHLPLPTSTNHPFKHFPDIKRTKNAQKSIQRSMDRYRFRVW